MAFAKKHLAFLLLILLPVIILPEQVGYRVPTHLPSCHYRIDARIDPDRGVIEGKAVVSFKNDSRLDIGVLAFEWKIDQDYILEISAPGTSLTLINPDEEDALPSPLFYRLREPLLPGSSITLFLTFRNTFAVQSPPPEESGSTHWYPRIWWDGLPTHDSFSVKLESPDDFALAFSGRLDKTTGRYEAKGVKSCGYYLGRNQICCSREVEGVQVTTLATQKGASAAAICLDTAVDSIRFYKEWLGFYPYPFLYIIPGGKGRWGGYPFATGIVVIHGEETYKEGESNLHWQQITAHEIGHEYWGEWVLDPDKPAWFWIGMGIFADTKYVLSRKLNSNRRSNWFNYYINGVPMHYDTTVDIPPHFLSKIRYDRNNTVIHSKGFGIISSLDSVLGRETFERIYKKCLQVYGGKHLGWREFQRFCELESGRNLNWFFEQMVRSNTYLCYQVDSTECRPRGKGFLSVAKIKQAGTMTLPVPVKAVFEDGSEQRQTTSRHPGNHRLNFSSRSPLKQVVLDPEGKLPMLKRPLPVISDETREILSRGWRNEQSEQVYEKVKNEKGLDNVFWHRLAINLYDRNLFVEAADCFQRVLTTDTDRHSRFTVSGWLGLLYDLMGERRKAIGYYREALRHDSGETIRLGWTGIRMNRNWLEERLHSPFVREEKKE